MSQIPFNVLNTNKSPKKKNHIQSQMIKAAAVMGLATVSMGIPLDKVPILRDMPAFENAHILNQVEAATLDGQIQSLPVGSVINFAGYQWTVLDPAKGYLYMQTPLTTQAFDTSIYPMFDPSQQTNIGYYLNTTWYNTLPVDQRSLIQNHLWNVGPQYNESLDGANAKVGLLSYSEWEKYYLNPYTKISSLSKPSTTATWLRTYEVDGSDLPEGMYVINGAGGLSEQIDVTIDGAVNPAIYLSPTAQVSNGTVVLNSAPIAKTIPTQTISKTTPITVDLSSYFTDADGDLMTYTATSSDTTKATVSISGSTLTLTPKALGSSIITATANDGNGHTTNTSFTITVANQLPSISLTNSALDQFVNGDQKVTIQGTVSDPDNDNLTVSATIAGSVQTASVSGSGTFTLQWDGMSLPLGDYSNITVTVSDGNGGSRSANYAGKITIDRTPPVAPSRFRKGDVTATTAILQWDKVTDNAIYTVYRDGTQVYQGGELTFLDAGLNPNTQYTYTIKATVNSLVSPLSTTTITTLANPVSNIVFTEKDYSSFRVSWDGNGNPAGTEYNVIVLRGATKLVDSGWISSLTGKLSNLNPNTAYTVEITARNSEGVVTAVTTSSVTTDPFIVNPVTNLQVVTNDSKQVALSWDATAQANMEYVIEKYNGSTLQKTFTSNTNSFVDTEVKPNNQYTYKVKVRSTVYGSLSDPVSITANIPLPPAPLAPQNVSVDSITENSFNVNWDASNGVSLYYVEVLDNGVRAAFTSTSSLSTAITGLKSGKQYTINVYGIDTYGQKSAINTISVTTAEPAPIVNFTTINSTVTGNDVSLSWDGVTGAYGFYVERYDNGVRNLRQYTTNPNYTDSNVPSGDHEYRIITYSVQGMLDPVSKTIAVGSTTTLPPENLSNFNASVSGNNVNLSWNPVTDGLGYYVERYQNGVRQLRQYVTTTSYTDSNVPDGDYEYHISVYNKTDGELTPVSKQVTISTSAAIAPQTQVQNLNATVNGTSVALNWDALQGTVYGYYVERWVGGVRQLRKLVTTNTYTDTDVPVGNVEYRVIGYTKEGGMLQPTSKTVTIAGSVTAPVSPVQNLISTISGSNVTLSWDAENVYGYYVERYNSSGTREIRKYVTTNSYVDSSVKDGQYTYKVIAYSKDGMTDPTSTNVTIGQPSTSTGNTLSTVTPTVSGNTVTLNWAAISGAYGYYVERWNGDTRELRQYVTTNQFVDTSVSDGTYTYKVIVYSTSGMADPVSANVTIGTVQPPPQDTTPTNTLADTVTTITPTINGSSVSLDWNDVNNVYGYYVERWQGTTRISRTYVTNSNFTENNVSAGDYTYKIIVYSKVTRGFLDPVTIDVSVS